MSLKSVRLIFFDDFIDTLYIDDVYEKESPIMKIGVIQGMVNAKITRF